MSSSKSTKTSESWVLLAPPKQLVLGFFQFHQKSLSHAWVVPVWPKNHLKHDILPISSTLWVLGASNSYKTFMSLGFFYFYKHDFDSWVLTIPPNQVIAVGFFPFHQKSFSLGFFLFCQIFGSRVLPFPPTTSWVMASSIKWSRLNQ